MAWSEQSTAEPRPWELLDDGLAVEPCDVVVIGCGNILRGDDAAGPVLVRQLYSAGVPDRVRVVDGGTSGMDVAFSMRGAARVVIVDAAATGAEPGTLYRVPAADLVDLPPVDGLHSHNFRWDHALSISSWLLGPHRPDDITVLLVEAGCCDPGAPLSPAVQAGVDAIEEIIVAEFYPPPHRPQEWSVTLTESGHLHLPAVVAATHFAADVVLVEPGDQLLHLIPLHSAAHGGLVLKQRNAAGDRSVLVHEAMGFMVRPGEWPATWDSDRGALRIDLTLRQGPTDKGDV